MSKLGDRVYACLLRLLPFDFWKRSSAARRGGAGVAPARKASRIDPQDALRAE